MTEAGGRGIADAFRSRRSGEEAREQRSAAPEGGRGAPRRGRRGKAGKRSNPDYVQVSALVTKDVRAQFAVAQAQAAAEAGRKIEFGELVNLLMAHFAVGAVSVEDLEESVRELRYG